MYVETAVDSFGDEHVRLVSPSDIREQLLGLHADPVWLEAYLGFIDHAPSPQGPRSKTGSHKHHILPRGVFLKFKKAKGNSRYLLPADHVVAHYYLYRALPNHPIICWEFESIARDCLASLRGREPLFKEISEAYSDRLVRIRSSGIDVYIGEGRRDHEHRRIPADELKYYLDRGWSQERRVQNVSDLLAEL
jgi:hypothetical protein